MLIPQKHHDAAAYILAMASTATSVVGLRLDDVQWGISVLTSLVGAVIALYIFERGQVESARLKREAAAAEERRRQKLLDWEQRLAMREIELRTVPTAEPLNVPLAN
jgi:hypothetical protein